MATFKCPHGRVLSVLLPQGPPACAFLACREPSHPGRSGPHLSCPFSPSRWYFAVISVSGVFAVTFSVVFAYVADITQEHERSMAYGQVRAALLPVPGGLACLVISHGQCIAVHNTFPGELVPSAYTTHCFTYSLVCLDACIHMDLVTRQI